MPAGRPSVSDAPFLQACLLVKTGHCLSPFYAALSPSQDSAMPPRWCRRVLMIIIAGRGRGCRALAVDDALGIQFILIGQESSCGSTGSASLYTGREP
jgi:hypothetical protein